MSKLMTVVLLVPVLFSAAPAGVAAANGGGSAHRMTAEARISPPTASPAQCALWKRVDPPRYRKHCL